MQKKSKLFYCRLRSKKVKAAKNIKAFARIIKKSVARIRLTSGIRLDIIFSGFADTKSSAFADGKHKRMEFAFF